jgi:hypothetical protein
MGPSSDGSGIGGANYAKFQELDLGLSKVNSIKNFTQDGDYTEILIPKSVEPSIDWQASSFGVSTQCRALRNDSCDVGADAGSNVFGNTSSFNCTKERAGVNIHGTVSALRHQVYFLDWHRVIKESPPFESYTHNVNESYVGTLATLAAELSDDDGGEVFSNPWSFIAAISFAKEALDFENDTDKVVWKLNGRPKSMLLCNATGILGFSAHVG